MNEFLLPDKIYLTLKWTGLVLLPALAALIGAVGPAWGLPHADAIVLTVNAVGTFIGVVIGASQISVMGQADRDWDE